jgi:hypothetical protein
MKPNPKPLPGLADLEREVLAEAREWGRQRLEERLQQIADEHGETFPPQATQKAAGNVAKRAGKGKAGR